MSTSGIYSSAIPIEVEPNMKASILINKRRAGRCEKRLSTLPNMASIAPVDRMTASEPPINKRKKIIPCASPSAFGITVNKFQIGRLTCSSRTL